MYQGLEELEELEEGSIKLMHPKIFTQAPVVKKSSR